MYFLKIKNYKVSKLKNIPYTRKNIYGNFKTINKQNLSK